MSDSKQQGYCIEILYVVNRRDDKTTKQNTHVIRDTTIQKQKQQQQF
jgi:hypothetical protein